ncbi:NAD-dependent epimerase/dehydratase family protein [Listeria sp. PSOL-1]|uniref:NAD-dependent epimerase/dehydratase family protein n=1 Tax=Listeria sp. PSOL-1 TaxID=1844999 RepID=UPI0013D0EB94|nr:NAD-dependent epimerase/dehydratase family protein [Listeria sp. PSOL-1]
MKILVLGGTRFFGKKLVERLIEAHHDVTIATRGTHENPFGEAVAHKKFDRRERDDLFELAQTKFDVVYDNICYSPQEALYAVQAFKDQSIRYIFTSTLAVYCPKDKELFEDDFDPAQYEIVTGDREDFYYGEGKRLAEAVYFQKASFPVVAVRFPIVLDEADYTKRLEFHLNHMLAGEEIGIKNKDAHIGFIQANEAARFLEWIGTKSELSGAFNAASNGIYTLSELIDLLETITKKTAVIEEVTEDNDESPFDLEGDYYLNTKKAQQAGFQFDRLADWFPKLAQTLFEKTTFNVKEEK